jgi:Fe2+ transport system protein FeoA
MEDACAMEHSLSDLTMDHLVKFFEFLEACPEGTRFMNKFHGCSLIRDDVPECKTPCKWKESTAVKGKERSMSVRDLKPGARGRVKRIDGSGAVRQRLLDMGIMPNVLIEMTRVSPAGDPVWVKFQGTQLSLRRKEAESVLVSAE